MTAWRTASACNAGSCVEVAPLADGGGVLVRDGKDPDGPSLRFDGDEWAAFLAGVRAGEFDLTALAARTAGDGSGGDARSGPQRPSLAEFEAAPVSR
ncbi:DUF397 domain-containing protein [Nonomuraea wenchangensis]|uniref:DUF397 domain-containing protein n=1 Tax=Nonomuraea wenchangensis TaxID=568860 RepID=A0A1I0EZ18_9ACTN|nr:protein of unknown function [Nonomuraea wenchangensis]